LREAPAGFGLERLATAFMNNPGQARENFSGRVVENGMILAERAQHMLPNWLRKTWVLHNAPFRYYEWK
jgi:hypothetical protein